MKKRRTLFKWYKKNLNNFKIRHLSTFKSLKTRVEKCIIKKKHEDEHVSNN